MIVSRRVKYCESLEYRVDNIMVVRDGCKHSLNTFKSNRFCLDMTIHYLFLLNL